MTLRELRVSKKITQEQAAKLINVSRKTYIGYENNEAKLSEFKKAAVYSALNSFGFIDETHGVLSIEDIKHICGEVFKQYDVKYAYLFGSYAKSKARPTSDVDLLVEGNIDGLKYFEFLELLREGLKKNIDVLDKSQLLKNEVLLNDILKDGIKIYG